MSNLDSKINEEGIVTEPISKSNQAVESITWFQSIITSQRRNLQNLSALVVFNFAAAGLFFITQVKIANVIGKEQFGILAYGIAIGMYGQTIVRYGMDRTLVRDLIHSPHSFAELVTGGLYLWGGGQVLIIIGLLIWKFVFDSSGTLSWGLIAVVIAYSLKSLDLQPVYDVWLKMGRHAAYNLIQRGLYFAFIWLLVFWLPKNLSITYIGFGLLGTQIIYLLVQQKWAFQRIDFKMIKSPLAGVTVNLLRNNFWIWLASIGVLSFGSLNQIILKHYCGAAELGGYAASWQVASVVILLLLQVCRIGNPATAHNTRSGTDRKTSIRFLLRYSGVMLLTAAPICIPLCLFPEFILKIIFKPEYASAGGVLRILSVYILILSLGTVASQYVVSARMERAYFASVTVGGIFSVVLCIVLIPKLAGLGAALALLIAHGTSMGLFWVVLIQHVQKQR